MQKARALPFKSLDGITRNLTLLTQISCRHGSQYSGEWNQVYKFQHIQSLASFNKLKNYQVAFSSLAIPVSFAIPAVDPIVVAIVGVTGAITLSLASVALQKTIGFIYTNQKHPDRVKFAFLDFWGRRKDVEIKIEDVMPLSELPTGRLDNYFTKIQFYNDDLQLKLFFKHGGVNNIDEFSRIFGDH